MSPGALPLAVQTVSALTPGCAQDLSWGSLWCGDGADKPTLLRSRRGDRRRPCHLSPTGARRGEQGERIAAAGPVAPPSPDGSPGAGNCVQRRRLGSPPGRSLRLEENTRRRESGIMRTPSAAAGGCGVRRGSRLVVAKEAMMAVVITTRLVRPAGLGGTIIRRPLLLLSPLFTVVVLSLSLLPPAASAARW